MNRPAAARQPQRLQLEVPAEPQELPPLRDRILAWLDDVGCPAERTERVLLAANEAVTNAIEHAYPDGTSGRVRVTAETTPEGSVRITVADDGTWRPVRPAPTMRGRGVLMMQVFGDDVRIRATEHGTVVEIVAGPSRHAESAAEPKVDGASFAVDTHFADDHVVARVSGDVPEAVSNALVRELLAASWGGVAPLTIDVGGVGPVADGLESAVASVAGAATGVGGRVSVVVPEHSPVATSVRWDRLGAAAQVTRRR